MTYQSIEAHPCFGGMQYVLSHWSNATQSDMRFAIYLPAVAKQKPVPVLYWLSGLTCSEQNFITKAGAQRVASEIGLAIVVPDTSPRGIGHVHDVDGYVGEGASFYVDATEMPWAEHYQMYSYLSDELPRFIASHFPIDKNRCGILGHSMGGHGALMIGLRNNQLFRSLSAFSPICSLMESPWGKHALSHYLGKNEQTWQQYDACYLIQTHLWPHGEILIDQGLSDPYLIDQLKPELFAAVCKKVNVSLNLRMHDKYTHNYYFIATFIEEHLRFHANNLQF